MSAAKKEKQKHLGRGLESLLGSFDSPEAQSPAGTALQQSDAGSTRKELLVQISLDEIKPNPYQPRSEWKEEELEELAESIQANGIIQPVILRKNTTHYEIVAGERRFRAAKMVGLDKIPAVIRQASDEQMLELALVENIHRSNLNPIERAKAYKNYIQNFSISQTEAAERLGENRSVIANHLRLLDLPQEVKKMLTGERLSMGHARALLSLPDDDLRKKLANRAMAGRLSVREVEKQVKKYLSGDEKKKKKKEKPANVLDLEKRMTDRLGTKVNIKTNKNMQKGRIVIEFYSIDDFDRITDKMGLNEDTEVY